MLCGVVQGLLLSIVLLFRIMFLVTKPNPYSFLALGCKRLVLHIRNALFNYPIYKWPLITSAHSHTITSISYGICQFLYTSLSYCLPGQYPSMHALFVPVSHGISSATRHIIIGKKVISEIARVNKM